MRGGFDEIVADDLIEPPERTKHEAMVTSNASGLGREPDPLRRGGVARDRAGVRGLRFPVRTTVWRPWSLCQLSVVNCKTRLITPFWLVAGMGLAIYRDGPLTLGAGSGGSHWRARLEVPRPNHGLATVVMGDVSKI